MASCRNNGTLVIRRTVRRNSVGLSRWAMCMTFLSAALRIRIKIWCPYVFSRGGIALCFTQFVRWKGRFKNKHFLVCHSHTPTHSVAPLRAPSDSVTALVHLHLNKAPCIKEILGGKFYIYLLTFICLFFFLFFSIARNMCFSAGFFSSFS